MVKKRKRWGGLHQQGIQIAGADLLKNMGGRQGRAIQSLGIRGEEECVDNAERNQTTNLRWLREKKGKDRPAASTAKKTREKPSL